MIDSYEKNNAEARVRPHFGHRNRLASLFDPGGRRRYALGQAAILTRPLFYLFTLKFKAVFSFLSGRMPSAPTASTLSTTTNDKPRTTNHMKYVILLTAGILTIPLIAMQFTSEVNWTFGDFLIMGILLFSTGTAYVLISRVSSTLTYRLAVGTGIGTGFFLMWSNMAVGLIGSEDNLINVAYFGLIAVGFAGALVARFQPKGMTLVMGAIAVSQMAIAGYALLTGAQDLPHSSVGQILGVNAFFTVFWVASALLFRQAAGTSAAEIA